MATNTRNAQRRLFLLSLFSLQFLLIPIISTPADFVPVLALVVLYVVPGLGGDGRVSVHHVLVHDRLGPEQGEAARAEQEWSKFQGHTRSCGKNLKP